MRIIFVSNPVMGGWSPTDMNGLGGGEEIAVLFTAALVTAGHDVTLVYDGPPLTHAGVEYVTRGTGLAPFDVAIYFKCPELADPHLAARLYLWTDQERAFQPDPFRRIFACSEYLRRHLASVNPRCIARLDVLPYGIDCAEVLAAGEGVTRDPKTVLHCASPDRGLVDFLRDVWPRVLAEVPDARLRIAYGWELFDKYGGPRAIKAEVERLLAALPAGTWTMERLDRAAHHRAFWECAAYAYYCTGGEQFGLTALKAQLAGCVPVVKPWGALHETVDAAFLIPDVDAMVRRLVDITREEDHDFVPVPIRERIREAYDWPKIVARWEAVFADESLTAPLISPIITVPGAPPFSEKPGFNLAPVLHPVLGEWFNAIKTQRPWIDPTLGFPPGPVATPDKADAIVLGFACEDAETTPAETLRALGIKPGTPTFLVASHGTWRATTRRRALSRADLLHVLGRQADLQLRAVGLTTEGDGVSVATFRLNPETLQAGRDWDRTRRLTMPRETLSACFMVRNVADTFGQTLQSIQSVVDEVVVCDTGATDSTPDRVNDWRRASGIPVTWVQGTSPRWCFDCLTEHAIGEMGHGHRMAGFETPRNQSLAPARGDHILWMDADEELLNPGGLHKYLQPNCMQGYGIPQHHHSVHPPEASKIDFPVRLFRRQTDHDSPAGFFAFGPQAWPTFHSGHTTRFTGIVHEHPGSPPTYTEGLGPVIIVSDVWISHRGYLTEDIRRKRFVRNWPLMVADRQKYPTRRLGRFLWIRDLSHQMRYLIESAGNVMTPEAAQIAEEACALYMAEFAACADAYTADASAFASTCMQALGRGIEFAVDVKARKPEISGDAQVVAQFAGRFDTVDQVIGALKARLAGVEQWQGPWI
jgi:glycosyltransferase involved in cell wall biosynthesis